MYATIHKYNNEGYIIRYSDGTYQTEGVNIHIEGSATRFKTIEQARTYLEASYPLDSTWKGYWMDGRFYFTSE